MTETETEQGAGALTLAQLDDLSATGPEWITPGEWLALLAQARDAIAGRAVLAAAERWGAAVKLLEATTGMATAEWLAVLDCEDALRAALSATADPEDAYRVAVAREAGKP